MEVSKYLFLVHYTDTVHRVAIVNDSTWKGLPVWHAPILSLGVQGFYGDTVTQVFSIPVRENFFEVQDSSPGDWSFLKRFGIQAPKKCKVSTSEDPLAAANQGMKELGYQSVMKAV